MTREALLLVAGVVAGFGWGAATHAVDFVRFGWWPYRFGPLPFNLFWNMLVVLDAGVVVLLLGGWRRLGLTLGIAVIAADVAINAYAWRWLDIGAFATAVSVQAAFLGFVIGATGLLWPQRALARKG